MRRILGQGTWVSRLTEPSKGGRDQSMPEKRRQARSASRTLRKTRVTWSKFDHLKSNPDRDIRRTEENNWSTWQVSDAHSRRPNASLVDQLFSSVRLSRPLTTGW